MKKFIVLIAFFLVSCTHFEPQIATQSVYYENAGVELSQLMVYTRPEKPHYGPISALFYPYHVTQSIPNGRSYGAQISKLIWQQWTGLQLFPSMVYDDDLIYRGLDDALFTARSRGYDLLIVGFVPYLYLGHTVDSSALTIQVKIYETRHGQMLCSFEQSGRVEKRMDDDFIVVKRTHRMPESALYSITQAIAKDMAVPLTSWALFDSSSSEMSAGLKMAMRQASERQLQQEQNIRQQAMESKKTEPSVQDKNLKPDQQTEVKDTSEDEVKKPVKPRIPSINLAIQFSSGKSDIAPESLPILDELGKALTSDSLKDKKISITGHTDSDASQEANLRLSRDRAETVKKYLVENFSITPDRLVTRGVGSSQPLVPNTTDYNKQFNRRVEISVLP